MSFIGSVSGAVTEALAGKAGGTDNLGDAPKGDDGKLDSLASQLKDAFEKALSEKG